jgi:phage terminase large subunit
VTQVFEKNATTTKRIVVNQGGTRSSKTYSILQFLITLALESRGKIYTICRKTLPSLKSTAYKDFFHIIEGLGIYDPDLHSKGNLTYFLNGNEFEFISVDEPTKIRGRKRNILFMNEANEFHFEDWQQLILRTSERIFIDYNPSDEFHWIYDNVLTRKDCTFIKSTYLDNPFLDNETIKEIERLKELDENYWRVYGLGERGASQQTIFRNYDLIDKIPDNAKQVAYGLDFGFSADPTALIEVFKHDLDLYINEVIYEKGLTNQDIAEKLKLYNVERQIEIIADSAEPKSIEEIYRMGFNVKPSRKGADSIKNGIDIMKRYKIKITKNSLNVIKEIRNYKWLQDKNNKILNKPVDAFNHTIDAIRYVCLNKLNVNHSGNYYVM